MSDLLALPALSSALAKLVADASPAIVTVTSHRSRASGFVWKDGFVVTADETLAPEPESRGPLRNARVSSSAL